jgi:dipeptidyl aminopeptidase/acylaminoacyl peptidase
MFSGSKFVVFRAGAWLLGVVFLASLQAVGQAGAPATARARIEEALKGIERGHAVGQVAVSPDGKLLAWIERAKDGPEIRLAPLSDPKKSTRVTAAADAEEHCQESDLAWSPDARALAFFSDCAHPEEQSDLYLFRLNSEADGAPEAKARDEIAGKASRKLAGTLRQLTELHGYAAAPAFAPDGSRIAFLYVQGATRPAGALAAMKPWAGVIGEEGIEIQRVAVARADAAKPAAPQWATPAGLHVYEFDWRPDSQGLAYIAAHPPGENNWWVAKLYTQALGAAPVVVLDLAKDSGPLHGLQMAAPRWSPDGRKIAFIGGLMSDQGSTGGDVWVLPAAGGEAVNLTPQRTASAAWIEWAGNEEIFVSELAGSNAQLILLRLHGKSGCTVSAGVHGPVFSIPATVGDGRMEMSLSAAAGHELFVFRASSFDRPEEIYAARADGVLTACAGAEAGNLTQLTHWSDGLKPGWGSSASLTWKSDGFKVQGWLMQPKDYDPARKYPLIVLVHGGPAAAVTPQWGASYSLSAQAFSALGYFVLQPNPRGSFGQGEAFTQANRKDFGYGDLRDILAGVDAVLAKYPVDPQRVGLTGWSYGGFLSMFAVTQTGRFKAAVAGAGISDWKSYYGENSIDQWMLPYFGASVYDDPAVYARSSAIDFIKNASTPTLVVVGDRDGECPAPQSFEFWHALRAQGVATQLVVYPNEGHGFVNEEHRRDVLERALEWFDRYLRTPAEGPAQAGNAGRD